MSALKIKDDQGNWINLPGLKGDKGDKGDKGESGVYLGTTAPNDEDINVWINPNGEAHTEAVVVDPTLMMEGQAADAKKTGDEIADLKGAFNEIESHMPISATEVKVDDYTAIQYMISPNNGNWTGTSNVRSVLIPIENIKKIAITANNDAGATIAILASSAHTPGTAPSYATGCTKETVSAGETKTFDVPSDATYLYVRKSYTTTTYSPSKIYLITYIDVPTIDAIESVKSDLENVSQAVMIDKNVAITDWYQGTTSPTNGSNQDSVKTVRTDFIYVEDTYLNVIVPNGYVIRVMVYAIRAITSYTGTYTEFSSVDLDISAYRGKYIKLNLKYNVDAEITPSDVSGVGISYQTFTDTSLTVPGKAPDSKVVGDGFKAINDAVGKLKTADFVKPESGNATKVFLYPVQANKKISFYWSGDDVQSNDSLNLYSRVTASGENAETLKAAAKANTRYEVTPTVDANYLRVVATKSGTISVYDSDTLLSDISALKSDVEKHDKLVQKTPFVRFGFNDILYDPSDIFGENGEIGDINNWESKAEALAKVHAAFDALCSSGGAGYGYGERITGLYKESAEDESLVDVIAPSYVTSGVSEGDTVILPIGTDTNGDPVTYNYTYESNTDPYEVRLYRFRGTNNALHTATVDIPKKKILLVGGTHGNEFCAPINLYVLAKHLCTDYSNPDVLKLRSAFDVYIVPYLNGFGCQYQWSNNGVLTTGARCNGRMVDINRNCYTAGWVGETGTSEQITTKFESKISNLATNTFAGSGNGSEFESQLIKGLLELIKPDVFIDHHHNSGNSPFYTTCRGNEAGNIIYQAANDSAYARLHNMPEYFGTKYNLFLGSDVSPATKSAANGHMDTMAYELGISMNAVSEMPESIAYLNGVVDSTTKAATKYSALAFKQAEYTLLNLALHMCQWAMEH